MKNIVIYSASPDHAQILRDLLRAYFPGINIGHRDTTGGLFPDQPGRMEGEIRLEIREDRQEPVFRIRLTVEGQTYTKEETRGGEIFAEDRENRRRRLLRLALHGALQKFSQMNPGRLLLSPWGVLTGVRPVKIVHRLKEQGLDDEGITACLTGRYGIREDKARLAVQVAEVQTPYFLSEADRARVLSLYLAIPFCPSRCHYCSFPSLALGRWGYLMEDYLQTLGKELQVVGAFSQTHGMKIENVYVGGGTPTTLTSAQLARLLDTINNQFTFTPGREHTVEAGRPDTLDAEKLSIMKNAGVTRLSINPQTMCDETLKVVGRKHSVKEVREIYELARKTGFPVINMDLIIGLPGETMDVLKTSLTEIIKLEPENITLHALALKRGTCYKEQGITQSLEQGGLMMDYAQEALKAENYIPYYLYRQKEIMAHTENVGFARAGMVCRYNIQMMEEKQTIIGFGVGAGSKIVRIKDGSVDNFYNPKDLLVYLERREEIVRRKVDKLRSFVYNDCNNN